MDLPLFDALDIVLVGGLPASGKSHFSATYFSTKDRRRINRKELRRLLWEMGHFGKAWREEYFNEHDEVLVGHVERKIFEHYLQSRLAVLVDNTSVTVDSREYYVTTARQLRKTIGIVFLNSPLQRCLERNRGREDSLSEGIITNLYASLELPTKAEGFKEVLILADY